jgi:hypothetical protein
MPFVYHLVPEKVQGDVLYPLTTLKKKFPKVYLKEIERYKNRKEVLKKKIPFLNCLWNDVLHFTPVNPKKIKSALLKEGFKLPKEKWYKINAKLLGPNKSIIYLYKYKKDVSEYTSEDNFVKYNPNKISQFNKIPLRTVEYYRELIKNRNRPLRFHFIPHVFLKGSLDISNVPVIEV